MKSHTTILIVESKLDMKTLKTRIDCKIDYVQDSESENGFSTKNFFFRV